MTGCVVIAGGGLAGCLAALALAERRPETDFLLLEAGESFGGNHIWSFFDSDLSPGQRWLVDGLAPKSWSGHDIRFPARQRRLAGGYNSIASAELDRAMRARLDPARYRLGTRIAELRSDAVVLEGGETIPAGAVIDARGPTGFAAEGLAWQKFLGLTCRFARPHGIERPIVMDAKVDQSFGYRFVYTLPFSPTELLIEDTYYATEPAVDSARLRRQIGDYARAAGLGEGDIVSEEIGVLPIVLAGAFEQWWPSGPAVARLGLRGGFFHPTTGYSLPDAVANALLIAGQRDLSGAALAALLRRRAERLWRRRGFYRMLNRMLFRAAAPQHRYRVLEHFYRLPEPVIARFYAGRTTALDKLRILSGRPPVRMSAALRAARAAA